MTILEKKAASGIDTKSLGLGRYVAVGLAGALVGIGAVLGVSRLVDADELSPARVAEIRSAEYAELAESQWIAQVNATRGDDLVEFYSGQHLARIAEFNSQRADDLVEYHASRHQAMVAEINERRAEDMVTFKRGWEREAGS